MVEMLEDLNSEKENDHLNKGWHKNDEISVEMLNIEINDNSIKKS